MTDPTPTPGAPRPSDGEPVVWFLRRIDDYGDELMVPVVSKADYDTLRHITTVQWDGLKAAEIFMRSVSTQLSLAGMEEDELKPLQDAIDAGIREVQSAMCEPNRRQLIKQEFEIEQLQQQLAAATAATEFANDRIKGLISQHPPHEAVAECVTRCAEEAMDRLAKSGVVTNKHMLGIVKDACESASEEWRCHYNFRCEMEEEARRDNRELAEQLADASKEAGKWRSDFDAATAKLEESRKSTQGAVEHGAAGWGHVDSLKNQVEDLKGSRVRIMRAYDPNCDEFNEADEIAKMTAARQIVEAMQELASYLGRDPEGCLTDVPDEAMSEIEAATARAEQAEADCAAMRKAIADVVKIKRLSSNPSVIRESIERLAASSECSNPGAAIIAERDKLRAALEIIAAPDMWQYVEGEISGQDGWACDCWIWKGAGDCADPTFIAREALEKGGAK